MIRNLIKNSIAQDRRRVLYEDKCICGCIFRSFNELEANIFFRFTTNGGRMTKQQLQQLFTKSSRDKVNVVLRHFLNMDIIRQAGNFELNLKFAQNVEKYIMNPQILQPVRVDPKSFSEIETLVQPSPSSFLKLLFQEKKIPQKCKFKPLAGHLLFSTKLSKEQFNYIKSSISTKIGLLIEGILNIGNLQDNIRTIVKLNLLLPGHLYKRSDLAESDRILTDLQKINLVKITGKNKELFSISKYLHHYTFQQKYQQNEQEQVDDLEEANRRLNKQDPHFCQINIIIETNFKVYTTVQSTNPQEINILRKILKFMLKSEHENTEFQEMIIGEIEEEFMKNNIFSQGITAAEFFDFFKQYMKNSNTINIEPDKKSLSTTQEQSNRQLGKWKKLKFLGLDGPDTDSTIPSNVRQEVKLWQKLYQDRNYYESD